MVTKTRTKMLIIRCQIGLFIHISKALVKILHFPHYNQDYIMCDFYFLHADVFQVGENHFSVTNLLDIIKSFHGNHLKMKSFMMISLFFIILPV